MHEYTNEWPWKLHLHFLLVILSGFFASIIGYIAEQLHSWTGIPLSGISALVIYIVFFKLIDLKLWKIKNAHRIMLVPDLNGEWRVTGKTLRKNGEECAVTWEARISIQQSWTKICIGLVAGQSSSRSVTASIIRQSNGSFVLHYLYLNDPELANADIDMRSHIGAARLIISANGDEGSGVYFTNESRTTAGAMDIERVIDDI